MGGGGGLHVHVYQFKLKGLAGGGGREGWVSTMSLFFAKMVVRQISRHLSVFKVLFRSHIPRKFIIF